MKSTLCFLACSLVSVAGSTSLLQAESITASYPEPQLDRWMYAFGSTTSEDCPMFAPFGSGIESDFDDKDGQGLFGFTTSPLIPSGHPAQEYRIISARLTLRVSRNNAFIFDPTYDAYNTYWDQTSGYIADADAGKPIELYACGYRGTWNALTYEQDSAYADTIQTFASFENRNVFPAASGSNNTLIDVSNNVKGKFETSPLAIGQAQGVAPGSLVPKNTDYFFDLNVQTPATAKYLQESLSVGRVNLITTCMNVTTQQAPANPAFYLRASLDGLPNPNYAPAKLEINVCVSKRADWNCSGSITVTDIFNFLSEWFAGNADFNASGTTTVTDIFSFLSAWFAG